MDTDYSVLRLSDESCRTCLQSFADTNSLDDEVEYGNDTFVLNNLYMQLLRATNVQVNANNAYIFCI